LCCQEISDDSDIPKWLGGRAAHHLFLSNAIYVLVFKTKYHSKELNAKDDSNNSSSAFAKSERSDRN